MCAVQRTEQCVRWAEREALHTSRMPPGEMQAHSRCGSSPAAGARADPQRRDRAGRDSGSAVAADAELLRHRRHEVLGQCCAAGQRQARRGPALGGRGVDADSSQGQPVREARMLVNRAEIELALGRSAQALATVESALPALANGDLKTQPIEANAQFDRTVERCLRSVGRRRRSNRCARRTATGSPTSRKANGLPKPNTGSRRPIWPTAMRSAGAGWRRRRSAHWRNRPFKPHRTLAAQSTAPRR